jgi:hypothetical protein
VDQTIRPCRGVGLVPGGADATRLAPDAPTSGDKNNACGCDTRVGTDAWVGGPEESRCR